MKTAFFMESNSNSLEIMEQEKDHKNESGQVLSEYVILLAMFTGVTLMLMLLLTVFHEYGWRLISLVGMEYP